MVYVSNLIRKNQKHTTQHNHLLFAKILHLCVCVLLMCVLCHDITLSWWRNRRKTKFTKHSTIHLDVSSTYCKFNINLNLQCDKCVVTICNTKICLRITIHGLIQLGSYIPMLSFYSNPLSLLKISTLGIYSCSSSRYKTFLVSQGF